MLLPGGFRCPLCGEFSTNLEWDFSTSNWNVSYGGPAYTNWAYKIDPVDQHCFHEEYTCPKCGRQSKGVDIDYVDKVPIKKGDYHCPECNEYSPIMDLNTAAEDYYRRYPNELKGSVPYIGINDYIYESDYYICPKCKSEIRGNRMKHYHRILMSGTRSSTR